MLKRMRADRSLKAPRCVHIGGSQHKVNSCVVGWYTRRLIGWKKIRASHGVTSSILTYPEWGDAGFPRLGCLEPRDLQQRHSQGAMNRYISDVQQSVHSELKAAPLIFRKWRNPGITHWWRKVALRHTSTGMHGRFILFLIGKDFMGK